MSVEVGYHSMAILHLMDIELRRPKSDNTTSLVFVEVLLACAKAMCEISMGRQNYGERFSKLSRIYRNHE